MANVFDLGVKDGDNKWQVSSTIRSERLWIWIGRRYIKQRNKNFFLRPTVSLFSRAVLLFDWKYFGVEISWRTTCRRCTDDVRMTCGWHESKTSLEISAGRWHMSSGRCLHIVRTCTHHPHIVCMSSAPLLMVSVGLNYLLLWQEFVIWWNLWQECWIVSFQDHVNDLRDNLCWWFSLHVASGHCSHLICICTYHLHIIWAYAYYAYIICTSPSYVLS